jgi:hypothetical protein
MARALRYASIEPFGRPREASNEKDFVDFLRGSPRHLRRPADAAVYR